MNKLKKKVDKVFWILEFSYKKFKNVKFLFLLFEFKLLKKKI